ncbi:MAG: N-formylglutamate amidohydrolase [Betaproteobacteria bacterium]|nr:N-formylglutamate amidohydrolase [Betaproteobacteria bacterium]
MSLLTTSPFQAFTATSSRSTHNHDVPVVFDSPHSGTAYPDDFDTVVPRLVLRRAEDTHVEALYASAPDHGAVLIAANFPRSYIDANRSLLDIDAALLDGNWPGPINVSRKTEKGIGLVWRLLDTGEPIYTRKLTVAEVQARISRCYAPYHKAVRDAINGAHKHYGAVWHINCHSMPATSSVISEEGPGVERADFVLGDRDGTTCAPEFTTFVALTLRAMGYDVRVNDPYKGVELVRAYSDPAAHKHSLQIEVNRKLYMDENSRERNSGFDKLQGDLARLIRAIGAFAREHLPARGHHHDCGHDHHHDHDHHHGHKHHDH